VQETVEIMAMCRPMRASEERRGRRRYPVALALHFLTRAGNSLSAAGEGTSINISSSGMLFRSPQHLQAGERVIAAIRWPPIPQGRQPLLLVEGTVVWEKDLRVGMTLSHYRFLPDDIPLTGDPEQLFQLPRPLTPTKDGRYPL
jgi:hypothetical protein